ncbi:ABC transporter ATP-binding protein [Mycoplasma sp. Ms02]|uniref:ABC transporter ATP-binding protein n=1 Tax=Mycoplasma sp. Ms02 TaxID=353851 RepID=UPI001C89E524|nr:ABC transporter ATP-binding protein [Mycoplasma sp. Ms02]QZE12285.1 ABC transporter ATP-binding protein [Mycoplasma sp. Ms02]
MENKIIEFVNISKHFGAIKANQDINIEIEKGKIHALIGENGAGKSTLMSILFGMYEPDSGMIKFKGSPVSIKDPNFANSLGIGMVHQHFKLVDVYTNLENIIMGDEISNPSLTINYNFSRKKIEHIQKTFNLNFDLDKVTGTEPVSVQQKVEIMKMLYRNSDILIFDEPTAVLTDEEINGLLETFKIFRKEGKTILFISHKLREIKEVADNATVMRHGKVVKNFKVSDVTIEEMADMMVGENFVEIKNTTSGEVDSNSPVILDIQNVSTEGVKGLKNLNLKVRAGEIVAVAGVDGNGQKDLEYVISGMIKPTKGRILLRKTPLIEQNLKKVFAEKDKKIKFHFVMCAVLFVLSIATLFSGLLAFGDKDISSKVGLVIISIFLLFIFILLSSFTAWRFIKHTKNKNIESETPDYVEISNYSALDISKLGFSFIPSDRHKHGLALDFTIKENTILRRLWDKKYFKWSVFDKNSIQKATDEIIEAFDVRGAQHGRSKSRSLSGGNQQKFIVGREMLSEHDFILILQPTRGLDVGAIKNIHSKIIEEKNKNKAVLLISYELDEILMLADTIAVINGGEINFTKNIKELTRQEIGIYMSDKKSGGNNDN